MNVEEKRKFYKDFIRSEMFTSATYGVLIVFRDNIARMINLIELHGILLKRIESGDIKHNFPEKELTKIKQLILVDSLSKTMILIESLLNLLNCLAKFAYKEIPRKMIRYKLNRILGFIERFQKNKISIWKVAGFPKIEFLKNNCGLTKEEGKFIDDILNDSCEAIKHAIDDIIKFYQANRIHYGKFKHGLLFMPGLSLSKKNQETPNSFFISFDRLGRKPVQLCFEGRKIYPEGLEWFNTYGVLQYSKETFRRYSVVLGQIKSLSEHIINNHLLWASNCGQDYLPMRRVPVAKLKSRFTLRRNLTMRKARNFKRFLKR